MEIGLCVLSLQSCSMYFLNEIRITEDLNYHISLFEQKEVKKLQFRYLVNTVAE